MPSPDDYRPWRHRGVALGFVRKGTYFIRDGRRAKISTGIRVPAHDAAVEEYKRWAANPAGYVPRGGSGPAATHWDEAVTAYLAWCPTENSDANWIGRKASYLAAFGDYRRGGQSPFRSLDSFTRQDVEHFFGDLMGGKLPAVRDEDGHPVDSVGARWVVERDAKGRPVRDARGKPRKVRAPPPGFPTRNRALASLQGLMTWARDVAHLTANTADQEVTMAKEDQGQDIPRELPERTWKAILAQLDEKWRLVATVQLGAGLRYGEVARLEGGDVRPGGIHVRRAKRRKDRVVPASAKTIAAARRLTVLEEDEKGRRERLFPIPDDGAGQFDHRLEVACRAAGVDVETSHAFRHTYGTVTLRNGLRDGTVGLRELQARMGHARLATTERYLHVVEVSTAKSRRAVGAPL